MRFFLFAAALLVQIAGTAQMREEEQILNSGGELKGTLLLPLKGKKFSLLIIQAGSGPTDRNGNSPAGIKANSYRLLAETLTKNDIAVLLTDKRGIAGSAAAGKTEKDLRFDMYADDLAAWIRYAKKDKRLKKIFIAGHSEGSLVGMLAAQKEKINGYISLAGAGESIDKILVWQVTKQLPKAGQVLDSLLQRMVQNKTIDTVPPYLASILRPSVQPYMASWINYDPCSEIKKLHVPVLIIQGSNDIQVEERQATLLHACRPDAIYRILPGMNHVLKEAPADRGANLKTYYDATLPLQHGLAKLVADFIKGKIR